MDINTVRGLCTLAAFVAFVAIFLWAYSSKRKSEFHQAAHIPLMDPHELAKQESNHD